MGITLASLFFLTPLPLLPQENQDVTAEKTVEVVDGKTVTVIRIYQTINGKKTLIKTTRISTPDTRGSSTRSENNANESIDPEKSSLLYAYGGSGYYRWKMVSASDFISAFSGSDFGDGISYSHKAEPFILKKYGIVSNLLVFSLGLDYFSDRFGLDTEFNNEEKIRGESEGTAEQLKFLSGLRWGNTVLHLNYLYREFQSTLISQGNEMMISGVIYPINYFPETGPPLRLFPGDSIAWYTTYKEFELSLENSSRYGSFGYGFKYTEYRAPTEVEITGESGPGDILIFTRNRMVNIFMKMESRSNLTRNLYFKTTVPLILAGYYLPESPYFKLQDRRPFSSNTLTTMVSSEGTLSLEYLRRFISIEAGMDYGFHYLNSSFNNVRIKRDIDFRDNYNSTVQVIPSGSTADIQMNRIELFWGFFVHACIHI